MRRSPVRVPMPRQLPRRPQANHRAGGRRGAGDGDSASEVSRTLKISDDVLARDDEHSSCCVKLEGAHDRLQHRQFPDRAVERDLRSSRRAVVFTGAGISTESGIPDYRSPGGIWTRFRPIDFQELMTSEEARREYWRRKFATHEAVMQAKPNSGHLAIAELVRLGKVAVVVTQNVDGLHQASGIPRDQVIELHGNTTYAHCLSCGKEYDLEPIRKPS